MNSSQIYSRTGLAVILLVALLAAVCFAIPFNGSTQSEANLQQLFTEAGKSYDAGKMEEALKQYNELFSQGYISSELFFNTGNAYFKAGKIGSAVLSYRRAWTFAPRDPDILANIKFAQQTTAAPEPAFTLREKVFLSLSHDTWAKLTTFFYWLTALSSCLFFLRYFSRLILKRVAAFSGVLLVISTLGVTSWISYYHQPEYVVIQANQQALSAPLDKSTPLFSLPEGTLIKKQETSGLWVKVAQGRQSGWVLSSSVSPVYPWH